MDRLDITTIILTYNEAIHIGRCLENVNKICKKVFVVDCHSTDKTCQIAKESGAVVVEHDWPGNQAAQFNWAIDNLDIDAEWILRLDADEYLLPELIDELRDKLPHLGEDVSAISLSRARAFMGKQLRHNSVNDVDIVRIFRKGKARYEQRIMDEHLVILEGGTVKMEHQFVDDNRMPIGQFIEKHNNYASREAAIQLDAEYGLTDRAKSKYGYGDDVNKKRNKKDKYSHMPLFKRAFRFFIYRYILKGGFRDGKEGFCWDFFQGWWYRILVDAKIYEAKQACGDDKEKIKEYVRDVLGVKL